MAMPPLLKRAFLVVIIAAVVVGIAWAFTRGRGEIAAERAREAPIIPPNRVREVDGQLSIVLDAATQHRIGIGTSPIGTQSQAGTVTLTGDFVQDPNQVTSVRAPIPGRLMAIPGSQWPTLGERVGSGQVLAGVSDAAPLTAPRAGTVTQVTAQPGEIVQAGQELLVLTNFDRLLVRIVWRSDAPSKPPRTVSISPLGDSSRTVQASLVGSAAMADTVTRSPVFLYRVNGSWLGARPGLPIVATVTDPRQVHRGIFVPNGAAVQWNGLVWVYVERSPGQFVRVGLDTSTPVPGGWLVQSGLAGKLAPGARVVVQGTEQLLSEEFRAGAQAGGETDRG